MSEDDRAMRGLDDVLLGAGAVVFFIAGTTWLGNDFANLFSGMDNPYDTIRELKLNVGVPLVSYAITSFCLYNTGLFDRES